MPTELSLRLIGSLTIAGQTIPMHADLDSAHSDLIFTGGADNLDLHLGTLLEDIPQQLGINADGTTLPPMLHGMTVRELHLSLDARGQQCTFTTHIDLPLGQRTIAVALAINYTHRDGTYQSSVDLMLGKMVFDLQFDESQTDDVLVATYTHTGGDALNVRDFVAALSEDLSHAVPGDLAIQLDDIVFAYHQRNRNAPAQYLLALDIGLTLDMAGLPLVGTVIPADYNAGVESVQVMVASADWPQANVASVIKVLPETVRALPDSAISRGISLVAILRIQDAVDALVLELARSLEDGAGAPSKPSEPQPPATTSTDAMLKWIKINKHLGPLNLARIGFQYKDAVMSLLLDASLQTGGLTLSLDGLSLGSPLNEFKPQFNLRGLGLDYTSGSVAIGGAFVRYGDEFDGAAVIRTEEFTLSALGSYTTINGEPSIFVYAFLDYPLGGPSFFFVTGLAAGFGYNRTVHAPDIDAVAQFPLVSQATGGSGAQDLTAALDSLHTYIPPADNSIFLAVGVRFTTFEIIDSFALVMATFGNRFELDVLGLSTLTVPSEFDAGKSPLAEAQLALRATFIPSEGFLGVQGQLTPNSYILSRSCHLQGGFAFYTWFKGEHGGDFVQTLGGYHPAFKVPAHYPSVPRIGFNWQVDSHTTISGQAYYALTPSALMAGGSINATWQSGALKAWFSAGIDFLISWKPYHYDARFHVSVGASYTYHAFGTHHISVHIGVDVHVWGPDFAGEATIDLSIISFTVNFGPSPTPQATPIEWSEFVSSFLPSDTTQWCSISVQNGLVKTPKNGAGIDWVINPKQFKLRIESTIPVKNLKTDIPANGTIGATVPSTPPDMIGVRPVGVPGNEFMSWLKVSVTHDHNPAEDDFNYATVDKNVPAALWKSPVDGITPQLNEDRTLPAVPSGLILTPARQPDPGITHDIDRSLLEAHVEPPIAAFTRPSMMLRTGTGQEDGDRRAALRNTLTGADASNARKRVLAALGVDIPVTIDRAVANDYVIAPQIIDTTDVAGH